ncbi:MAG: flavin reductase family protein [Bacteroidales bacterium]|nr:flavin reductase family protein [Bacteroidales bacterium]
MTRNTKRVMRAGNMLNPTPVVMVSCGETVDEYNIITVAWTGTLCSDPPLCYISVRPSRHSYDIIRRTGEFVINLVSQKLAAVADWCGVRSGKDYHKFIETGLTPIRGTKVSAPMIDESPVNIECKVQKIVPLGTHDMFVAEVLAVHAKDALFNRKTDALELQRANLVTYSHGHYYNLGKIMGKFGFSVEKK